MTEQEKRQHRCCFAGHRPEAIPLSETAARDWLRVQIQAAIASGFTTFITGMGMGMDIWAAQEVLRLRSTNPALHLIAIDPTPASPQNGQRGGWMHTEMYFRMLIW